MRALKFNLNGRGAFFKKPDVNSFYYFTYGSIHKIALLGIIGAVLGLKGYADQGKDTYPEFYEKLKDVEVSIVPKNSEAYISKKVQIFNNSVGYASKEEGGNLIVKEQWLEDPEWNVYIKLCDSPIFKEIEERFLNRRFVYIPYLGKNDHIANIKDISVVDLKEENEATKVTSFVFKKDFSISTDQDEDIDFDDLEDSLENKWKYEEKLPIKLEETTNQYITETMMANNMKLDKLSEVNLYREEENILYFF
ncbi:type I-B CRISPR-associated protein Cas5b [Clostridium sp. UBA1652]|uniref:type I-B CRISPR-associated protein Cas5b n=1 Tax=Clostridium sp. UBA1652 TaxID=1946348 RepID=UPI00257B031E|nr:type I-B CRISPR-associated protein Cas5b [Clostridium sp. UBA1652]